MKPTLIPVILSGGAGSPPVMIPVMIEVQSGAYVGEDDTVRFEDLYGRDESKGNASGLSLSSKTLIKSFI